MMNTRSLGLLVLAILIMSMLVYFHEGQQDLDDQVGTPVLPDFKEKRDQLSELEVVSSSARTTLSPVNGHWGVMNRNGYPVNFDKLVGLLDALSGAVYEEKKTSKPENFGVLDLRDLDQESSNAVRVHAVAGDKTFELLVGAGASGREGQFIRHPDDNQTWLVDRPIEVSADPSAWLDPVIIDIPEKNVVQVHQGSGDEEVKAERAEDADNLTIRNLPESAELRYPTVADGLARALTNVRLTDVEPRTGDLPEDAATAWYKLADGGEIVVNAWKTDGGNFMAFDLENIDMESEGRRIEDWMYQVSQSTLDKFTRTMEDMIKTEDDQSGGAGQLPDGL